MTVRWLTAGGGATWEHELLLACAATEVAQVERRCYDFTDLLMAADSGMGDAVVLSSDLPWLDHDVLGRLRHLLGRIIVVLAPGDEDAPSRLHAGGVAEVVEPDGLVAAVFHGSAEASLPVPGRRALLPLGDANPADGAKRRDHPSARLGSLVDSVGLKDSSTVSCAPDPRVVQRDPQHEVRTEGAARAPGGQTAVVHGAVEASPIGQVVAVWGPTGAPGRTTVAVNLALELAATGRRTLLVDADTYGAAVGQTLGFLTESAGVGGATRLADQGMLDAERLRSIVRRAEPEGPWVLTGLTRPDLWRQVSAGGWEQVLARCTESFEVTVVDVGFCLEEGGGCDDGATRPGALSLVSSARNAMARVALQEAQLVVAVSRADPVGLAAFLHAQRDLWTLGVAPDRIALVVNRFRSTLFGATGEEQIYAALQGHFAGSHWVTIPDDTTALDAALLAGRALREVRHGCAAQRACAELASLILQQLYGAAPTIASQRRWRRRRKGESRRSSHTTSLPLDARTRG